MLLLVECTCMNSLRLDREYKQVIFYTQSIYVKVSYLDGSHKDPLEMAVQFQDTRLNMCFVLSLQHETNLCKRLQK